MLLKQQAGRLCFERPEGLNKVRRSMSAIIGNRVEKLA
jgi:hypothetical protein